jgi:hypothetical protein
VAYSETFLILTFEQNYMAASDQNIVQNHVSARALPPGFENVLSSPAADDDTVHFSNNAGSVAASMTDEKHAQNESDSESDTELSIENIVQVCQMANSFSLLNCLSLS